MEQSPASPGDAGSYRDASLTSPEGRHVARIVSRWILFWKGKVMRKYQVLLERSCPQYIEMEVEADCSESALAKIKQNLRADWWESTLEWNDDFVSTRVHSTTGEFTCICIGHDDTNPEIIYLDASGIDQHEIKDHKLSRREMISASKRVRAKVGAR